MGRSTAEVILTTVDRVNRWVEEFLSLAGVDLKETQMAILKSEVVPKNSGSAFEVKKGQRLRIAGKSIVGLVYPRVLICSACK